MRRLPVLVALLGLVGCSAERTEQSQWWPIDQPTGASFEIVVQTGFDGCDTLDRVEIAETDRAVEIQTFYLAYEGRGYCTASIPLERVAVSLNEPLGTRSLRGCTPEESDLADTAARRAVADCRHAARPDPWNALQD